MKRNLHILILIVLVTACKKQINIPAITAAPNYLVADGHINVGDSTTITLSRTINIAGKAKSNPELNATVTIESSDGTVYPLVEKNNGVYMSAALNLPVTQKYRLKIVTVNRKEYASDFVPVKNSPPIDTVGYVAKSTGLQINVSTHDATNSTKYYQWEYTETYNIRTPFDSKYIVVENPNAPPPDFVYLRTPEQQIHNCWISDTSSTLVLGSSAKLSQDIISAQAIQTIPANADKFQVRYSILVKQYALTSDAFNYFDLLKRNSEQLGGIFDAQPSELTGNIHCLSNPEEPVIGYIIAGAISQKRIFIDKSNLPPDYVAQTPYGGCHLDTLLYRYIIVSLNPFIPNIIINQVQDLIYPGIELTVDITGGGYLTSSPLCVDCTIRGTNKQPLFWK